MTPDQRALVGEIRERLPLATVVGRSVKLQRAGRELRGLCPFHAEKTPSFYVVPAKGFWHCFGCSRSGDLFGFVQQLDGVDFPTAIDLLAREAGVMRDRGAGGEPRSPIRRRSVAPPPAPEPDDDVADRVARACAIWRAAAPAAGTVVPAYLRARGIRLDPPPTLRFARLVQPDAKRPLPAMVAAIQAVDRRVVGVHRTWLLADGSGKAGVPRAKMMLGQAWGGAIRLAPAPVDPGAALGLAEGIETALSVMQARAGLPVWAAGSLGNIAGGGSGRGDPHPDKPDRLLPARTPDMDRPGFVPPPGIRRLVLFGDADGDMATAVALMDRAAARYRNLGLRVRLVWPPVGLDFNDMLRGAA